MNLMHIKLKTGIDLVSYVLESDDTNIILKDPVQFGFDPNRGIFGIDWLMFSEPTTVTLNFSDILFMHQSSEKAIECYNQFSSRYTEKKEEPDYISELESIFTAMMESKGSIKH